MAARTLSAVPAYAVAVAAVAACLLLTAAVPAFREQTPFLPVMAAVIVASFAGGIGPGLFATVLGGLATDYLLVPPLYAAVGNPGDVERLVAFVVLGALTSVGSETIRRGGVQRERLLREAEQARREAESANRAKDVFLAMLSHELRSPLATVRTWTDLLRSGRLSREDSERALDIVDRSSRLQMRLVDDLLDVARIVSGKLRLQFRAVDLDAVVLAAVEAARALADEKGLSLSACFAGDSIVVWADPSRLEQIAGNLLSNAIKFTPEGGSVTVHVEQRDGAIQLTVEDSGDGIEPHILPHVFERFRQADSEATTQHGGLGLGLSIVRHLVEAHGGTIEARSAGRGTGATFVVMLPLHREDGAQREACGIAAAERPDHGKLRSSRTPPSTVRAL